MDGCAPGHDREVAAFADLCGLAERNYEVLARVGIHRVALSEQVLVLEEKHGILTEQCSPEHAHDVAGAAREHHDQPGNMREDRLAALGVP
jgi:hypothetical protein